MRKIILAASVLTLLSFTPALASDCGCATPINECTKETICKEIVEANKCFFDAEYKKMKGQLGLNCAQEKKIDCYYKDYKNKMSALNRQLHQEQKSLCKLIANDGCKDEIKSKKKEIKEIKKYMKNECKAFQESVKSELCKNQKKEFRKFTRAEKRKMKQLGKNCNVLSLPCYNNCQEKSPCETIEKPDCGCEKPKCQTECEKPKCNTGCEKPKYNYSKPKCNCK